MSQLLDQLRNQMQKDTAKNIGNSEMEVKVEYRGGMGGNIAVNNGISYHAAVKAKQGYYFDKNMILQEGLRLETKWVDPKKKKKEGAIEKTSPQSGEAA